MMAHFGWLGVGIVIGGAAGVLWGNGAVSLPQLKPGLDLPVVVYERPGLLSARDRELLEDRIIEPYIDYYATGEAQLLTVAVTVPAQSGQAYIINTIFSNGVHEGMLLGVRDGEIPNWEAPPEEGVD